MPIHAPKYEGILKTLYDNGMYEGYMYGPKESTEIWCGEVEFTLSLLYHCIIIIHHTNIIQDSYNSST